MRLVEDETSVGARTCASTSLPSGQRARYGLLALGISFGCYGGLDAKLDGASGGGDGGSGGAETSDETPADTTDPTGDPAEAAAQTRVARLTHDQYDNTVADLLGITGSYSERFAPDAGNGFVFSTNVGFEVDARLGPQYRAAAEELAASVVANESAFAHVVPCDPAEASCAETFLVNFGGRAFRRPLTADEQSRFRALFEQGASLVASGDDFRDGVQIVVEAALQSPQFLYRTDVSDEVDDEGRVVLDDWEIASRLSYFLWDSMPDEALFAQASRGELHTPEQIEIAVTRMLEDDRVLPKLVAFHEQAWQFDKIARVSPDPTLFPDAPSVTSIRDAARLFVEDVLLDGGGLTELLTAPFAYADEELASVYGVEVTGGMQRIELDSSQRKGFLTQAGFLASNAYARKTDPIHRGLLVMRDILCVGIPDPPPGASTAELPATEAPPRTTREEVSLLTGQPTCVGCHSLINDPGFAFEGFDAIGQARTEENGVPVDTRGSIRMDGEIHEFDAAPEMIDLLAQSADARACYATKLIEFALGRRFDEADIPTRDRLAEAPRSTADLVVELALSDVFLTRTPNE